MSFNIHEGSFSKHCRNWKIRNEATRTTITFRSVRQPYSENVRRLRNCNDLPFLVDVDITGSRIEKAARRFTKRAGPSGVDGNQLSAMLLNDRSLREAFANKRIEGDECKMRNSFQ